VAIGGDARRLPYSFIYIRDVELSMHESELYLGLRDADRV